MPMLLPLALCNAGGFGDLDTSVVIVTRHVCRSLRPSSFSALDSYCRKVHMRTHESGKSTDAGDDVHKAAGAF